MGTTNYVTSKVAVNFGNMLIPVPDTQGDSVTIHPYYYEGSSLRVKGFTLWCPLHSQLAPFVPSQLNHWCFSKCGISFLLPPSLCPLHQKHFLHSPLLPKCLLLQGVAHLTSLRVPVTPFALLPSDYPFHVVQWLLSSCLCWLSGRENELLTKSFLKFSIMDTGLEHLGPRTNLPS